MCKHARAWTCRKAKAIGQKCEKPWENQGFAAERTGTEQPTNPLGNSHFDTTRDAKYDARRFHCLRRLGTLSIATNLQLICIPIYRVTNSRPIRIYRVTVFRLQGHLQGHRSRVPIAIHSAFQFVTTLRRGGWTQGNAEAAAVVAERRVDPESIWNPQVAGGGQVERSEQS